MLLRPAIVASAALLCAVAIASPGHASSTRYVAANGTGPTCGVADPCGTLAAALSLSGANDTIVCLSTPFPSALNITIPITIDCSSAHATFAGGGLITVADGSGVRIRINAPAGAVRLRGLVVDGAFELGSDRGIDIQVATSVHIEDSVISSHAKQGIFDHRTGGQTKLLIKDTIVSGNNGAGIVAVSATGITVLDNVSSERNAYGIAVGAGNTVAVKNSVFSGNSVAGVEADNGGQIIVNGSTITHNGIGVQSASSVRLSNNDIAFNTTAFSGSAGTYGNNRLSGNGSIGTAPMVLGAATSDLGQQ